MPSGRAARSEAASSVAPVFHQYGRSLRPCLGTTIAPRRRATLHQTLLEAEVSGDHHPLDFIRALADLEDLLVAVEPRDRVLVHVPVATVDLEGPVDDPV